MKVIMANQFHLSPSLVGQSCTQSCMPYPAKFAPARLAIRRKPIRLCCIAIEFIARKVLPALRTPFIHLIVSHYSLHCLKIPGQDTQVPSSPPLASTQDAYKPERLSMILVSFCTSKPLEFVAQHFPSSFPVNMSKEAIVVW